MSKKRAKASEIAKHVYNSLEIFPQTINEISEESRVNWESTKNALRTLESVGLVIKNENGEYLRKRVNKNEKTFFGIKIEPEDENTIDFLFSKIREIWKEKLGTEPGKTQVQKCLVKVDKDCNLNLPVGWYLYGKICIKPYNPAQDYSAPPPENKEELISGINSAVDTYSSLDSVPKIKQYQYNEEFKNPLYKLKEQILLAGRNEFNKKNFSVFCTNGSELIKVLPKFSVNSETISLVSEFIAVIHQLSVRLESGELKAVQNDVLNLFNDLWKLIALDALFESLLDTEKYTKEELQTYLAIEKFSQKETVENALSLLIEYIPAPDEKVKSPEYASLRELQGSVELKEGKGELGPEAALEGAKKSSELFRKFNLD